MNYPPELRSSGGPVQEEGQCWTMMHKGKIWIEWHWDHVCLCDDSAVTVLVYWINPLMPKKNKSHFCFWHLS